jgi:hypothetical protein
MARNWSFIIVSPRRLVNKSSVQCSASAQVRFAVHSPKKLCDIGCGTAACWRAPSIRDFGQYPVTIFECEQHCAQGCESIIKTPTKAPDPDYKTAFFQFKIKHLTPLHSLTRHCFDFLYQ